MNKDFKIGLIIGLAFLIAGLGYFVIFDSSGEQKPETPVEPATNTLELVDESAEPEFPEPTYPEPAEQPAQQPAAPSTIEISLGTPAARTPAASSPEAPAPAAAEAPVSPKFTIPVPEEAPKEPATVKPSFSSETDIPKPTKTEPAPAIAADWALPDDTPSASETVVSVSPVEPVSATPSTYIVKAGDIGWIIAESVYGKGMGRYWKNIASANPGVKSTNLRPGLVLTIPPLPADVKQRISDRKRAGQTITNAAGQRVYIVSKNDTKGLWGISAKFYKGKGQYWTKIRDANPGVNADQLRPGMKLIIPQLDNVRTSSAYDSLSERTYGSDTVTAVTIRHNYYTVKKGDSFWTIAQKEYGHGKYAYLIKNANQGVNSNNLKPGQKLIIPPKPKSAGSSTTAPRPVRRRSTPAESIPDDEPDFGL